LARDRALDRRLVALFLVMFRGRSCALVCCSAMAACSQRTDPRLSAIEARIAQEELKLHAIQQEVIASEARAEAARLEAEHQACRAQVKEIAAEVERRRAVCAKDLADHNLCIAKNSERTATAGLWGCGLGIAAAAFSAGAATPWALGGCGMGLGAGLQAADECPVPSCAKDLAHVPTEVLSARGLSESPRCGGYAGISVEAVGSQARSGTVVSRVYPGTYGNAANMAAGDVVISINGVSISTSADFDVALAPIREGQALGVSVVRNGELFELVAPASRRTTNGEFAEGVRLGVEIGATIQNVTYKSGVRIASVMPEGPAAAALQVGDIVSGLSLATSTKHPIVNQVVRKVDQVETFLSDTRAADDVSFSVQRGSAPLTMLVHLGPRAEKREL
jgi:hypothetical protein